MFNILCYYLKMSEGYFWFKYVFTKVKHFIGPCTNVLEKWKKVRAGQYRFKIKSLILVWWNQIFILIRGRGCSHFLFLKRNSEWQIFFLNILLFQSSLLGDDLNSKSDTCTVNTVKQNGRPGAWWHHFELCEPKRCIGEIYFLIFQKLFFLNRKKMYKLI